MEALKRFFFIGVKEKYYPYILRIWSTNSFTFLIFLFRLQCRNTRFNYLIKTIFFLEFNHKCIVLRFFLNQQILLVDVSCQISQFQVNRKYPINFDSLYSIEIHVFCYINGYIFFKVYDLNFDSISPSVAEIKAP